MAIVPTLKSTQNEKYEKVTHFQLQHISQYITLTIYSAPLQPRTAPSPTKKMYRSAFAVVRIWHSSHLFICYHFVRRWLLECNRNDGLNNNKNLTTSIVHESVDVFLNIISHYLCSSVISSPYSSLALTSELISGVKNRVWITGTIVRDNDRWFVSRQSFKQFLYTAYVYFWLTYHSGLLLKPVHLHA